MAQIGDAPHPGFGHTVARGRWRRRQPSERLVVTRYDGVQIALASWRLAPRRACRQRHAAPAPRRHGDARLARRAVRVRHPTSPTPSWVPPQHGGREAHAAGRPRGAVSALASPHARPATSGGPDRGAGRAGGPSPSQPPTWPAGRSRAGGVSACGDVPFPRGRQESRVGGRASLPTPAAACAMGGGRGQADP
jgi:hypothetical protein